MKFTTQIQATTTTTIVLNSILLPLLLLLILETTTTANAADDQQQQQSDNNNDELKIHYTFKPEDCKRKAKATDVLTLHYKGTLEDGSVFDSSIERNEKFSFQLGIGQVIKGWDQGLKDVCEGEKRQLVVPASLGYGPIEHPNIPANSTLIFDVEIFKIEDGPNPINVFKDIDSDKDGKLSKDEVESFLKMQLGAAGNEHGDIGSILGEIFKHEDKDGDSFITREEFSGPKYDHDEL